MNEVLEEGHRWMGTLITSRVANDRVVGTHLVVPSRQGTQIILKGEQQVSSLEMHPNVFSKRGDCNED